MAAVFFLETKAALENITTTFDFVHPLRVSLIYTRNRVEMINSTGVTNEDFKSEIDPNNVIHGVDYKVSFIETAWEHQEELLAWVLLNNLFAIHEGWVQCLYDKYYSVDYDWKKFKQLQFPQLQNKFPNYFAKGKNKSLVMTNAFFDVYKNNSGLDFNKINNYMLLYRFFKEARNCYMHNNRVASQEVVDAFNSYQTVATIRDLDCEKVPEIIPPILGQPIQLKIRGVIGFSQFVRRILIISDTYLIQTKASETVFLSRKPQNWTTLTLSSNTKRAKNQITSYSRKFGLLEATWIPEYQEFLIKNKIFSK